MNPAQQTPEQLLRSHIAHYITVHTKVLTLEIQQRMAESLATFVVLAIAKFEKGQVEHGGNLQDRNLEQEITNETVDLLWYNEARKWRKL